jgi:hypothetical protein
MDLITIPAYHTSNSYGTLAQAEAYFSSYDRLGDSETWSDLSDNQKKYALMLAAKMLNTFKFRGEKVTRQQKLAFPRFTPYQIITEEMTQLATFYDITFEAIVEDEELEVEDNKFISTETSQDTFYTAFDDEELVLDQLIKVVRSGTEYLTVVDIDADGAWIQVKEDIEEETDLTTTIYVSDIFGFPAEIAQAQYELAFQVVDTKIFQGTVGEETEFPVASFNIQNALSVRYSTEMFKSNKFESSGAIDIVYHLLGNWMAGVKGGVV